MCCHAVRARVVAALPASVRTRLRMLVDRIQLRAAEASTDEWGRRRRSLSIEGWSRPLIGECPVPDSFATASPSSDSELPSAPSRRPTDVDLRCLFVSSAVDVGGLGEVVAFLATHLRQYGIDPLVMAPVLNRDPAPEPAGRLAKRLRSEGIPVMEVDERSGSALLDQWLPDVIYAHAAPSWVLDAAAERGIPYVDTLHGMHSHFGADWAVEALRSKRIRKIVAVSEMVRDQYLAGNPSYPAADIVAIPNAVEEHPLMDRRAMRSALGLSDEFLFVCLARHCLQKNTYGTMTAFAQLAQRRPEVHLVIAGRIDDDRYYRRVANLHEGLSVRDRIHLRDHMPAPRNLLAASNGFVLDSFFEGWALAPMESMSAGVPVVVSDVGGAREQIAEDASRGLLVANPLGDPLRVSWDAIGRARFSRQGNQDELIAAMAALVDNRDDYEGHRAQLAAESVKRFDAQQCLQAHAALLRSAVIA